MIFFHSPHQEEAAKAAIARLTEQKAFKKPIVTQVVPAQTFWRAEEYHQKYLEKRGAVSAISDSSRVDDSPACRFAL